MSFTIWTQRAVAIKAARRSVRLWRAVEAQHVASTRRLVDTLAEHEQLERLLEAQKPSLSATAARLHYLLATPFRYPAPAGGSRFRAVDDPGVFYGALSRRTACAEIGYWRWRFLTDSKGLSALGPAPQTLFQATAQTLTADLQKPPFARDARAWQAPDDYQATQAFGKVARGANIGAILYRSVRDPEPGVCGAVLRPDAFRSVEPTASPQTWYLTLTRDYVSWQRSEESGFEFDMRRWRRPSAA